ncbi:MAG: GtrA family protein [Culturomica sp.]|jgi:putative flippase GtrA|nr:GtrA family protein [Culturomica sp.]
MDTTLKSILNKVFIEKTDSSFFQLVRYTFVGGFAFIIDFGLLFVLTDFVHLHYLLSASISFTVGLVVNYLLSTTWVFSKKVVKNKAIEFLLFALIGLAGLGFNNLFIWLFTDYFGIYYLISKIFTTIIVYLWNFFARKYILFN